MTRGRCGMVMCLAVGFLWLACPASAINSMEPWIFGTLPYETTPAGEANVALGGGLGKSTAEAPLLGYGSLLLQAGALRGLAVLADCFLANGGWPERVLMQLRLSQTGDLPLDLGLAGGYMRPPGMGLSKDFLQPAGGLVVAREILDQSLSFNAFYLRDSGKLLRLGFRSSYLVTALKLGMEGEWIDNGFAWAPQVFYDLPGDLEIRAGLRLDPALPGAWRAGAQLSVPLFGSL